MGIRDVLGSLLEGYEQGRAAGLMTGLLSLKRDDETLAEIMRLVSSASEEELDQMEQVLAHSCQHAWTSSARQRAAKVYGLFRRFRG